MLWRNVEFIMQGKWDFASDSTTISGQYLESSSVQELDLCDVERYIITIAVTVGFVATKECILREQIDAGSLWGAR